MCKETFEKAQNYQKSCAKFTSINEFSDSLGSGKDIVLLRVSKKLLCYNDIGFADGCESVQGLYTHVCSNSTQSECIRIHIISQRKEYINAI